VNTGFCEKVEFTRVSPGRPSRTTSGTRTTGRETLSYSDEDENQIRSKKLVGFGFCFFVGDVTKGVVLFFWPTSAGLEPRPNGSNFWLKFFWKLG